MMKYLNRYMGAWSGVLMLLACVSGFALPSIALAQIENVALGKTATASDTYLANVPNNAFDGSTVTGWNAGYYPLQWIEVDLGALFDIGEIKLTVNQLPNGNTIHDVYVTYDDESEVLEHTFSGATSSGDILTHVFTTPLVGVKFVRVETTFSDSWVAWKEIEVLEADRDGDGFSITNECNDNDPTINPNATEIPFNLVDENCDGNLGACSICDDWKNHGQYVSCIVHAAKELLDGGDLTAEESEGLVTSAAQSSIGKKGIVPEQCVAP